MFFNLIFTAFSVLLFYCLGRIVTLLESIDQKLSADTNTNNKQYRMSGFRKRLEEAIKEQKRTEEK